MILLQQTRNFFTSNKSWHSETKYNLFFPFFCGNNIPGSYNVLEKCMHKHHTLHHSHTHTRTSTAHTHKHRTLHHSHIHKHCALNPQSHAHTITQLCVHISHKYTYTHAHTQSHNCVCIFHSNIHTHMHTQTH